MLTWFRGTPAQPPLLLALRSSKPFITLTVASAVFTDVFCYGIVVPVLPFALASRAHVPPARTQTWISLFLAVYGGALLATAPICGWLADRTSSRQGPLLLGLLALGASTAMLCAGASVGVLAVGRVLQGVSAAVVWVVGLALLVDTVGPEEVGQAMGYVGVAMSLGMLVAPLLGGVVFEQAGYYAVYAMAFGLIAVDVVLRVLMIEKKVAATWTGGAEESAGVEALGGSEGDGEGRHEQIGLHAEKTDRKHDGDQVDPAVDDRQDETGRELTTSATTPLSAISTTPPPSIPFARLTANLPPLLTLLTSRRVCNAIWASTIHATILTSFDAILPLYVRNTFHWTPTGAGLIFLPLAIVSFLGPFIGRLSDRHGPRWYAAVGFTLAGPCLILLRLVERDSLGQKVLLCALLALLGICLTLVLTPIMAEITYAVDATARRRPAGFFGKHGAYAQAYSLFNVAWSAGCLIGPLLGGLVNQAYGWKTTTLILGCVNLVTAVPTVVWTGGSIFKTRQRKAESEARDGGAG